MTTCSCRTTSRQEVFEHLPEQTPESAADAIEVFAAFASGPRRSQDLAGEERAEAVLDLRQRALADVGEHLP